MNKEDESLIIKNVLREDVDAFSVLVDRYKDMAVTIAYNIVLNKQDAEDIAQDSFIKAYTSLLSFKGNSSFSTWLYRIVLNTALNKRKRKKMEMPAIGAEIVETGDNLQINKYNDGDQKKYIRLAIDKLSEAARVCITLFYLEELSIDEVKEVTGFSSANIKILLYRGRKHLYNELHLILKEEIKTLYNER